MIRGVLVGGLGCLLAAVEPGPTYGAWQQSHLVGGGYVVDLAQAPSAPQRWFAWSDVAGLFRSNDAGTSWRMISGAPGRSYLAIRGCLIDPRDPDRLIIAAGGSWHELQGVAVSNDGGTTWRTTLQAQFFGNEGLRAGGQVLARDPQQPERIYAAASIDGIQRSDDGGLTWTQLGLTGLDIAAIAIDAANPRRLLVAALATSPWITRHGAVSRVTLGGGLHLSEDGGATWRELPQAPRILELHQVAASPSQWIAIADFNRPVHSTDGGNTWTDWSQGLPQAPAGRPAADSALSYAALALGPTMTLLADGNGGVWRRNDGDAIWSRIAVAEVRSPGWFGRHPGGYDRFGRATAGLRIDAGDPAHWFLSDWFAVWETRDAGSTWDLRSEGIENTCIHALSQDPSDPQRVHMGMGDNGYFASHDAAASFQPASSGPHNCKDVVPAPGLPGRLYALGPATWGWHANHVFVSDDAGQSWRPADMSGLSGLETERINSLAVDPRDPQSLFVARSGTVAVNAGGVWHSDNAGHSWTWMGQGLPTGQSPFIKDIWSARRELACAPDGTLLAISAGMRRAWRCRERLWSEVLVCTGKPVEVVADPHQAGGFMVAVEGQGLLRSRDIGLTWQNILGPGVIAVTCDAMIPGRIAAALSDEGGISYSSDGGDSWRELDERLPNRSGSRLAFAGDWLVVGTAGNGVFRINLR
jgi:photosystem II stability/assembly factor-like uncharacterized protein